MIGLDLDWDHDLGDQEAASGFVGAAGAGSSGLARSAVASGRLRSSRSSAAAAPLTLGNPSSKAKELLRRASEAAAASIASHSAADFGGCDMDMDGGGAANQLLSLTATAAVAIAAESEPHHGAMDVDAIVPKDTLTKSYGMLGSTQLPRACDPAVLKCTSKAPRMMGQAFSFRASARGGLIALPIVQSERGGSFRIKLLRLKPGLLCQSQRKQEQGSELRNGVELLEAHREVSFTSLGGLDPLGATMSVPRPLTPCHDHGPALLAQYLEKGKACLGSHAYEAFELLSSLLGDSPEQGDVASAAMLGHASHRFGVWLAQVNARVVKKHIAQSQDVHSQRSMDFEVAEADNVAQRLKSTFHCLTANSVRGALQELGRASASAAGDDARHGHFDRLATILASCGGTARGGCVERRQWLRRQVLQWRSQGVDELMGSALWRIYCLLAGEVDGVAVDALDWRTTFGMYLWYRSADEKNEGLVGAVNDFEAVCRKHGLNCRFRPAPPYLLAAPRRDPPGGDLAQLAFGLSRSSASADASTEAEPYDLQFSVVRAALGLVDWSDFKQFDYLTYSPQPMDVAGSWHFCLLLLALSRPESGSHASSKAFQQLTQQYCLSLELSGHWEWAVYVGLFVSDHRARTALIRGLLQRHSALPANAGLVLPDRPHWSSVPPMWIWRSEALRRERSWEWPAAVACWLRSLFEDVSGSSGREVERSVAVALGFLLMPAVLRHRLAAPVPLRPSLASTPAAGGSLRVGTVQLEAATLAPMTAPAKWLLGGLMELELQLGRSEETWAWVGRDVLSFMRAWAQAGTTTCPPERLAQLCKQCETAKQRVLGIPW